MMDSQGSVLLLVGSARGSRSTSESLGTYLCQRLEERGFAAETLRIAPALKSAESKQALLAATDRADILILAFPLFVDNLPYPVTRALELIARHRQSTGAPRAQQLLAIANSGFPEAHHNDVAIAICRQFAREAGFEWAGGLTLGAGAAIHGQPLVAVRGMARNVILSLDLAAAALAEGQPVPQEAVDAMARPLMPTWAYIWAGAFGWIWQAGQRRVLGRLHARPYQA